MVCWWNHVPILFHSHLHVYLYVFVAMWLYQIYDLKLKVDVENTIYHIVCKKQIYILSLLTYIQIQGYVMYCTEIPNIKSIGYHKLLSRACCRTSAVVMAIPGTNTYLNLNPCDAEELWEYICISIYFIKWEGTGSWNHSLWKTMTQTLINGQQNKIMLLNRLNITWVSGWRAYRVYMYQINGVLMKSFIASS